MRALASKELGVVRLGFNPRPYDSRDINYSEFRGALDKAGLTSQLPKPTGVWGHGNDFTVWPMFANGPDATAPGVAGEQGCGDCEIAGKLNETLEAAKNAGRPIPVVDGATAVNLYSLLSGYNPSTGANDNGLDTRTVLNYFQKTGLTDQNGVNLKIGPYFFGEPQNWQEYCEIAFLFEAGGIAWDFTSQMMDQFDAGKPWQYVANSTPEGGHYTAGMGPNHTISWTRNQAFTTLCYQRQNTEVSGYIYPERYNAVTGETLEGWKDADLEKFIVMVAQQKLGIAPARSSITVINDIPQQATYGNSSTTVTDASIPSAQLIPDPPTGI